MTKLTIVAAIALVGTLASGGVAGKWTMNVDTGSAHGIMTMGLTLAQDGKDVSGTFHSPHGDHIQRLGSERDFQREAARRRDARWVRHYLAGRHGVHRGTCRAGTEVIPATA